VDLRVTIQSSYRDISHHAQSFYENMDAHTKPCRAQYFSFLKFRPGRGRCYTKKEPREVAKVASGSMLARYNLPNLKLHEEEG